MNNSINRRKKDKNIRKAKSTGKCAKEITKKETQQLEKKREKMGTQRIKKKRGSKKEDIKTEHSEIKRNGEAKMRILKPQRKINDRKTNEW